MNESVCVCDRERETGRFDWKLLVDKKEIPYIYWNLRKRKERVSER